MIPLRRKRTYRVYRKYIAKFPVNGIVRSLELPKEHVYTIRARTAMDATREVEDLFSCSIFNPAIKITGINPAEIEYVTQWTAEIVRRK